MSLTSRFIVIVGIVTFCFNNTFAGAATAQLKMSIDEVLSILNNPELKVTDKTEERRLLVSKVLEKRFNFREMSKRALAKEWNKLNHPDRDEFVEIFQELLETTYIGRMEHHADEKVVFSKERPLGKNKIVVETVVETVDKEIPIHYNMMERGDSWLIYDVKIEGVGLVKNYRTQFREFLQKKSYQDLVKQLREKIENSEEHPDE